jgi:hypothetical protein
MRSGQYANPTEIREIALPKERVMKVFIIVTASVAIQYFIILNEAKKEDRKRWKL